MDITPKQKADEIFTKMLLVRTQSKSKISEYFAKESSLIAVDEIIAQWEYVEVYLGTNNANFVLNSQYWTNVKNELLKM